MADLVVNKTKNKGHAKHDQAKPHGTEVNNIKQVYCDNCGKMDEVANYQEPKFMCANCNYPIPVNQAPDKDNLNGVCPRCGHDKFTYNKFAADFKEVEKEVEQ